MAVQSGRHPLTASAPADAVKGEHQSLLLVMTGLPEQPVSGRLLRGLAPYLDEQGAAHVVLLTERRRREPWSGSEEVVAYQELVHWARGENGGTYRGTAWKGHPLTQEELIPAFQLDPLGVVDWAARRAEAAVVSTGEPLALMPCEVPKPWGKEIWYTGIEARGCAEVVSVTGKTELPYALGMFPVPIIGEDERPPVLLKALDPLPLPVVGDLYLEVHDEKWEVYVVLDVDRTAWPNSVGRLRAGLSSAKVSEYAARYPADWEERLGADLSAALKNYERIRRQLDVLHDAALRELGLDPARGIPAGRREEVVGRAPAALQEEEQALRQRVESFLGYMDMPIGAVACLRPGVLHSLQHGVKVIEFQTPTYERLIAMFAQKVLTQSHWDVDQAIARMEKTQFVQPPLEVIAQTDGVLLERVVAFPAFTVMRLTLQPGVVHHTATVGDGVYQLIIGVGGTGQLSIQDGRTWPLKKEEAYLLPASLGGFAIAPTDSAPLVLLITLPNHPIKGAQGKDS